MSAKNRNKVEHLMSQQQQHRNIVVTFLLSIKTDNISLDDETN